MGAKLCVEDLSIPCVPSKKVDDDHLLKSEIEKNPKLKPLKSDTKNDDPQSLNASIMAFPTPSKQLQQEMWRDPDKLSNTTKTSMAWAHFLGDIWHRYVNVAHKCEFISDNDHVITEMGNVLQHFMIFGGAPRDYILGEDIADIDMFVNTRELNKVHLRHLNKYHSTIESQSDSVKCCFWRLYAKKFKQQNAELNYQLNATFFAQILMQSDELKDKLSVLRPSVYLMKVLNDVFYKEYNFKDQELDLMDTLIFNPMEETDLETLKTTAQLQHKQNALLYKKNKEQYISQRNLAYIDEDGSSQSNASDFLNNNNNRLLQSMRVSKYKMDVVDSKGDDLKEISYTIHKNKVIDYILLAIDFSINSLCVFLSDFYYAGDIKYHWFVYGTLDITYLNDGFKDLKNKVLRTTAIDPMCTIKSGYSIKRGSCNTWRLIKFSARYIYGSNDVEWKIDEELKEKTIMFNKVWLNEERFTTKEYYEYFVKNTVKKYVTKASDHEKRFKAMDNLKMHDYIVPYFKKEKPFRECLLEAINSSDDEHKEALTKLLKTYGYTDD